MSVNRESVNEAYKTAMKARDSVAVETIRFLISDLKKIEIDERRIPDEKEVLAMVQRHIKKRHETIDAAKKQNRQDMIDAETAQLKVLEKFLPEQLTESALIAIIEQSIAESGAVTKKEQGKVMAVLMPKVQGKADGRLVAKLVGERLS